jgi:hypothetical protein
MAACALYKVGANPLLSKNSAKKQGSNIITFTLHSSFLRPCAQVAERIVICDTKEGFVL